MLASSGEEFESREGLASVFAAARTRLGLIAVLFALAAIGWWWSVEQMRGMDNGPWTHLGAGGWFLGVWVVMMAAMMFPSVSPTVALYSRMTNAESIARPLLFALGYLVIWAAAGAMVFAVAFAGGRIVGDVLAWGRGGRWVAATTLIVAAIYELTPLKDVCLGKCRSPLGLLLGSWREGPAGALRMGVRNGWRPPCAGRALTCDSGRRPGSDDSRGRDDVSDESDTSVAVGGCEYASDMRNACDNPNCPCGPDCDCGSDCAC